MAGKTETQKHQSSIGEAALISVVERLKTKLSNEQILEIVNESLKEETVPLFIFSQSLSPLESIVVYLRDMNQRYCTIAKKLARDERIIWATYKKAITRKISTVKSSETINIPLKIFADRILSITEALCVYLKKLGWTNRRIANAINKSDQLVWIALSRARRKLNE